MGLHGIVQNFIFILLEKDRMALPDFEIAQVFQSMADRHAGRVRASVQTAQGLSEEEQAEIRTTLAH